MSSPKRVRLKAVYLTDTERDLVRSSLLHLREFLASTQSPADERLHRDTKFSKSFTAKRLFETAALFEDKATGEPQ